MSRRTGQVSPDNLCIVKFFSNGTLWNANDLCCDPRLKAHADRNCTGRTKIRKKSPKIKVIHFVPEFHPKDFCHLKKFPVQMFKSLQKICINDWKCHDERNQY